MKKQKTKERQTKLTDFIPKKDKQTKIYEHVNKLKEVKNENREKIS